MSKKILVLIFAFLYAIPAMAQDYGKVELRGSSNNGESTTLDTGLITKYFTSDVVQVQSITATGAAFTQITIPTGTKALLIDVGTVRGLKLKGVTGDNGISLDSTCPVLIPISDDGAAIGLYNQYSSSSTVRAYFF